MKRWPAWLPALLGLVTGLIYWWMWGAVVPGPAHVDEAAYLLQARILAGGHWVAPGRPLPEFFEQLMVLVTPILAAKYPPGHSLVLALGEVVGAPPAIAIVLLNAATGAFVFLLASRLGGLATGLMAWALWLVAPMNLTYRASYLSNVTTGTLWVVGWWAALEWWKSGARRWLLVLAGCTAWCVITRPLTGLVYALPLSILVAVRIRQRRLWADLGYAAALSVAVLALLPLVNKRTTGRWLEMPWQAYARTYMPFDHLGFGLDSTAAVRTTDPELQRYNRILRRVHRAHTLASLPSIAVNRLSRVLTGTWSSNWPYVMVPFAVVGVLVAPAPAFVGLATAALLGLAHLPYAHIPYWIVYYIEAVPVLAFLSALGIVRLGAAAAGGFLRGSRRGRALLAGCTWVLVGMYLLQAVQGIPARRARIARQHAPYDRFAAHLARIPDAKALVFIRYARDHVVFRSLIVNEPDLQHARIWVAHDRGTENGRLLALAPERVAYLYDQAHDTLLTVAPARGEPAQ